MKPKPLNTFTRWSQIFRPTFVKDQVVGHPSGGPWKFWFLWNTVLAIFVTGMFGWMVHEFLDTSENYIFTSLPDFELDTQTGILSSDSAPAKFSVSEFFVQKFANAELPAAQAGEDLVIFWDMENSQYTTPDLEDYDASVLFSSEVVEMYAKEEGIVHRFAYKDLLSQVDVPENLEVIDRSFLRSVWESKIKRIIITWVLVFAFFGFWIWICLLRLLSLLFWAIFGWLLGRIMNKPAFDFDTSFQSLLYFGVPLGLIQVVLLFNGISSVIVFILSFVFLLGLLGMNIKELKAKKVKGKKH